MLMRYPDITSLAKLPTEVDVRYWPMPTTCRQAAKCRLFCLFSTSWAVQYHYRCPDCQVHVVVTASGHVACSQCKSCNVPSKCASCKPFQIQNSSSVQISSEEDNLQVAFISRAAVVVRCRSSILGRAACCVAFVTRACAGLGYS
jgi:hypothetical protein